MKTIISTMLFLTFINLGWSQTPSVSIKLRFEEEMYHGDTCESIYYFTVDKYNLKKESEKNYFRQDTSTYNWDKFWENKDKDFNCIKVDENKYKSYVFNYEFSRHEFVYEKVFCFNIKREKCGAEETMIFFLPVKLSCFVTFIELGIVYFKPGIYNLTEAMNYGLNGKYIQITLPKYTDLSKYKEKEK